MVIEKIKNIEKQVGFTLFWFSGFCLFLDRFSCDPGWPQTTQITEDDLEVQLLLFLPRQNYRHMLPQAVYAVLKLEHEALCMPGNCSTY